MISCPAPAAIISTVLTVASCFCAMRPAPAAPTNIIYILLDDAGYGDLSCYGQKKFPTPNIDRLASEGIKFTQHYSGSTVCAPTRSVLMSGLHTGHTPVRGNKEIRPVGQHPIPSSTFTIAEALKESGYATGAFGKWGLGNPGSEGAPENQGFDRFYGYNCQRNAHTYYPTWLFDNEKKIKLDGRTYAHDPIMREALKFIRASANKPFFCFLPVTIPHAAMHVPEKYAAPFRKKFPQFKDKVGKYAGPPVKNPAAMFAGMMTKLDEGVGQVISLVEQLGIDDNTLIMLSSDNGPHKEGGHMPDFFDSNGPLKGYKRDLYEGGIRVPSALRWPGHVEPGTSTAFVTAQDVLPTLLEAIGSRAAIPKDLDGTGRWGAITEGDRASGEDAPIPDYRVQGLGGVALIRSPWKLVFPPSAPFSEGKERCRNFRKLFSLPNTTASRRRGCGSRRKPFLPKKR